jgi:ADP-ribosylglycohydrolase
MELRERYRGALVGLAVGDAVGTTLEFTQPGQFRPIDDMLGGGPFGLQPGQWTDDTSMMLCLGHSLVERQGFDAADQMDRYVAWWRRGEMSCTGRCFDIGNTVRAALARFERTGDPMAGATDLYSAGNGSLMRLAPVPLAFATKPAQAIALAGESSRTTHGAREAVDACRYFAALLLAALRGEDKETILGEAYGPGAALWHDEPLAPAIATVAAGSFRRREPPAIRGGGFVVHCLEAALWAFYHATTYRDGCLAAANLGEDADTTAAVYGQLAGIYFGAKGVPRAWRKRLAWHDDIQFLADDLLALATRLS